MRSGQARGSARMPVWHQHGGGLKPQRRGGFPMANDGLQLNRGVEVGR